MRAEDSRGRRPTMEGKSRSYGLAVQLMQEDRNDLGYNPGKLPLSTLWANERPNEGT